MDSPIRIDDPEVRRLAREIAQRWADDPTLAPWLDSGLVHHAAHLAAVQFLTGPGRVNETVVDEVSGLSLPIHLRTPYQQRGKSEDGHRRDVIEHIQHEYKDYVDAGLFTTGFLFESDRPAYNALNYKATRAVAEEGRDATVADYCLRYRILTREHILHPPKRYRRQIELLKKAQTIQHLRKIQTKTS